MMKILPSNASKMKEEKAKEEWDGGIFLHFLQRAVKCPVNNVTFSKTYEILPKQSGYFLMTGLNTT